MIRSLQFRPHGRERHVLIAKAPLGPALSLSKDAYGRSRTSRNQTPREFRIVGSYFQFFCPVIVKQSRYGH